MQVCQNMTLYFQGWQWPIEFQLSFEWIYFPFSLDFFVLPAVPIWATYIAQFIVAFLAMIVVFWLSRDDHVTFQEQVIHDIDKHGLWRRVDEDGGSSLPNPVVDKTKNKVSVLDYQIGGDDVVGVVSRAALQNGMTKLLLIKDENIRPEPTALDDDQVITVLVSTTNSDKSRSKITPCFGLCCCCAKPDPDYIPEYISILAQSKSGLSESLKIAGFLDIERSGLLQLYRRLDKDNFTSYVGNIDKAASNKFELSKLIRTIASHYVLALHLDEVCKRVMQKFQQRVFAAETLLAQRAKDKSVNVAARKDDVTNCFKAIAKRARCMTSTDLVDFERNDVSLLTAAVDARIDVMDRLRHAELTRNNEHAPQGPPDALLSRDITVLTEIAVEEGKTSLRPAIAELIAWTTGRFPDGVEPSFEIDFRSLYTQYSSEIMPALTAELSALQRQVAHTMEVTERSTLYAGFVRIVDANGKRTPVFHRLIERDTVRFEKVPAPEEPPRPGTAKSSGGDKATENGETKGGPKPDAPARNEPIRSPSPGVSGGKPPAASTATKDDRSPSSETTSATAKPAKADAANGETSDVAKGPEITHGDKSKGEEKQAEPPQPRMIEKAITERKIEKGKEYVVRPSKSLLFCPEHASRLFSGVSALHGERKRLTPSTYKCTHRWNAVFAELCREKDDEKFCVEDDFYVCPIDECNFSICAKCMRAGGLNKVKAILAKQRYKLNRDGVTATIGLIVIFIAQAMYQPAMRSAITTVFCHASLSCQYPTCYFPVTLAFFFMSFVSSLMIFVIGIGLVWFLVSTVWERKITILESNALKNHLTDNFCAGCQDPEPYFPGTATFTDVLFVSCDEWPGYDPYQQLLARDASMFKGVYEQYEFRWMVLNPVTFFFKIFIVMAVLYAGEPNSLRLIVAAGVVEILQLVFYMTTSPFTDPWLDVLSKGGSLHQVAQLGLMCVYRADTYDDPEKKDAAYVMIALAVLYLILVIVVIVVVVGVPVYKAWKASKARDAEAAKGGHASDPNVLNVNAAPANASDSMSPRGAASPVQEDLDATTSEADLSQSLKGRGLAARSSETPSIVRYLVHV